MIIPNLTYGGAELDFCKVANGLSEFHNVYVVCFEKCVIPFELRPQIAFMGVGGGSNYYTKFLRFLERLRFTRAFRKEKEIDVSISYLEGANYLNLLSGKNSTTIISTRGSIKHDETMTGFLGFMRRRIFIPILYNRSEIIVSINHGILRELNSLGIRRPDKYVIGTSYNVEKITQLALESVEDEIQSVFKSPVIVTSGRLAIEKGYRFLIEAFVELKKSVTNAKLIFLGEGPEKMKLSQLAKFHDLQVYLKGIDKNTVLNNSDVLFLGFQSNPYKYISKARIFTITSSSEGGPNVLCEAMLCKTPVVSVDCPTGPREKIAPNTLRNTKPITCEEIHENGFLMPEFKGRNIDSAIKIWGNTLSNRLKIGFDEKLVKSAFHYVKSNFSSEIIIEKWNRLLLETEKQKDFK